MHIGIIAACLPTLKPLFASFFSQIRTLTKGRSTGSGGLSAPYKSNGYVKHNDRRDQNSFAMNYISQGSNSQPRSPYDEDVVLGKDMYTVTTSGGRKDRRQSCAGESEDSILSHDKRTSQAKGMAIMKTTEVNVTR
jgi:hypothetical protein